MSKESEHSGGKLEKPVTADEQPELTDTELEGTSGGVNRSFSGDIRPRVGWHPN